ncbi:hypothetical protein GCM10010399_36550 [Dactylosporangium fulvum]
MPSSRVALWYGLGHEMLIDGSLLTVEDLRQIVQRTGAWSVPLPDNYRPSDDDRESRCTAFRRRRPRPDGMPADTRASGSAGLAS